MTEPTKDDGLGAVGAIAGLTYTEGLDRNVEGRLRSRRAAWSGTPRQPTPEEQAVELGMEVVRLRDQLAEAVRDRDRATAEAVAKAGELTRIRKAAVEEITGLRRQVRDTLIAATERDQLLHADTLNQLLAGLDLEPVSREFLVEATVYAQQTVTVRVEARDADDARGELRGAPFMAWEAAAVSGWEPRRTHGGRDVYGADMLVVHAAEPVPGVGS